jgi:hypothetical protein
MIRRSNLQHGRCPGCEAQKERHAETRTFCRKKAVMQSAAKHLAGSRNSIVEEVDYYSERDASLRSA